MHFYKLQMNSEGSGQPDWQTIASFETQSKLVSPSEAVFWIIISLDDDKIIKMVDEKGWRKQGDKFTFTHINKTALPIDFQLLEDK